MNRLVARISVQLDYHPCTQFAGLHFALAKGLFAKRGLEVKLLPCSAVGGLEPELVCNLQRTFDREDGGIEAPVPHVAVGSVEQNVLIPAISRSVPCKAFGTIFQKSVLALGALPGTPLKTVSDLKGKTIAAHNDSQMELIQTLLSHGGVPATPRQVRQVLRANKMDMLLSGEVDAVQVYGLMEGLEIESLVGQAPSVLALEDLAATIPGGFSLPLGFSQVLFSTASALAAPPVRAALTSFMEVHEEAWERCGVEKEAAAAAVLEARAAAGLREEQDRLEWQVRSLDATLPVVRGAVPRIGAVSPAAWRNASRAMTASGYASAPVPLCASLDLDIWPHTPDSPAPAGDLGSVDWAAAAAEMLQEASGRASAFRIRSGRAPCVAVVSAGSGGQGQGQGGAWKAAGIEVREVTIEGEASFSEAQAEVAALNADGGVDGVVLVRPLGGGLDGDLLGGCIARDKDAGGESVEAGTAHAAHSELSTQRLFQSSVYAQHKPELAAALPLSPPWLVPGPAAPPAFATAVVEALERSGLEGQLAGRRVVVCGVSGAALAPHLLRCGAAVTLCLPSAAPATMASVCAGADAVFASSAAAAEALRSAGAGVVVVPSAACEEAGLALNVMRLAEARNRRRDAEERHKTKPVAAIAQTAPREEWAAEAAGWEHCRCTATGAELLRRGFACGDFNAAVELMRAIQTVSERVNHHPTLHVNPRRECELAGHGCEVLVELTTFATKRVTRADLDLARRISALAAKLRAPPTK